ncbi:hypothetical protein LOK74_04500 [Brevibacillus humidisoli]|uniref:hypothetical protein n=1 Tax=Brevibacillus humidisoli TaxID=2895522 RepID=UPI001E3CEB1F|nr:hypothetical protein [Brevibacillus humidisoli]UFJ41769.1 hypothetical protein LOK74_04500 [Brevibacillus humidisoli]
MRSKSVIWSIVSVLVLVSLFIVKVDVGPPADTRIILEHTYRTLISPPCFEQAEKTNNLGETTWSKAQQLGYKPESSCTEDSLRSVKEPLIYVIAYRFNLKESKWDW